MNEELDQWLARIEGFIADPTDDMELDADDVPRLIRELRAAHAEIDRWKRGEIEINLSELPEWKPPKVQLGRKGPLRDAEAAAAPAAEEE